MRKAFDIHWLVGLIGGGLYVLIELVWRGRSHWSMFLLGGVCFVLIGVLNEVWPHTSLPVQMVLGALLVTAAELAVGLVVNVWLGLGIWDYSDLPLQLWGQICLPYTVLWFFLSGVAVKLEDWLHSCLDKNMS